MQFIDNMITSHDTFAHVEESFYMDDVVVSTEYIGPEYVIGGISCDIKSDGQVNVLDVQLCVNVVLGIETDELIAARADANKDRTVNVLDVQKIVSIILGG